MTAVVERAPTIAAPSVTAAQVSRPHGSAMTFCLGNLGKLFADFRRLHGVGDDQNVLERHERQHAVDGLLEKGAFAEQRDELLGRFLAAHRPETFALAARHDDDETIRWISDFVLINNSRFAQR